MNTTGNISAPRAPGQAMPKKPSLLAKFQDLMSTHWRPAFHQNRTKWRLIRVLVGMLACPGPATVMGSIGFRALDQENNSGDHKVFSQSLWNQRDLFRGALQAALEFLPDSGPILVAMDDTALDKVGLEVAFTRYCHNPMAPKWQPKALKWAIPMFHAALLVPTPDVERSVAISIALEPIPGKGRRRKRKSPGGLPARRGRPPKSASASPGREEIPIHHPKATEVAVMTMARIRQWLDEEGLAERPLLFVVDGSYLNGTVLRGLPERSQIIGRTRKDCVLFAPLAEKDGKRIYGERLPTPAQFRQEGLPKQTMQVCLGGDQRSITYLRPPGPVLWKNGTKGLRLRLFIIEPTPYTTSAKKKSGLNDPVYLLTPDLVSPPELLLDAAGRRWQIEVLHRDMKSGIGVGEAQCWSAVAVERTHAALAAAFSMLLVAVLKVFGPTRTKDYPNHSLARSRFERYRAQKRVKAGKAAPVLRPSVDDILAVLRRDLGLTWAEGRAQVRTSRKSKVA